jgi:hypothetical protein
MSIASCNTCNGAGCFPNGTKCDDCGGVGCFPLPAERPSDAEGEKLEPVAWRVRVGPGEPWNYWSAPPDLRDYYKDVEPLYGPDAIASLTAQLDELRALHKQAFSLGIHHQSRAEAAEAEVALLRSALEFYADPSNYKGEFVPGGHSEHGTYVLEHHVNLVRKDGGATARASLQPSPTKTGVADGQ